jgi:hypothetical protein
MALTPPKVIDVDDPLRPRADVAPAPAPPAATVALAPDPASSPSGVTVPFAPEPASSPSVEPEVADVSQGDPYDGSPKVAVSMRATKELWDRLGVLSRRLEDEGLRTSRTELTEALWHFHAPETTAEARELVRRYRRARLG